MKLSIRPAVLSDKEAIATFTAETFEWGDYVADVLTDWIEDPDGLVTVATDDQDQAVAVGRGTMLSETELWLQGARVKTEWRRQGLASAIGGQLVDWARKRGALVARLGTETWNIAAQRQVESAGFRPVGDWVVAVRKIAPAEPAAPTNGGQRAKAHRKLDRTHSSDAIPAWVSWRSGPLIGPARGLHAWHWRWSRLELEYLTQAAKDGQLWSSQAGWAFLRYHGDRLAVGWLECGPDDAADMVRSVVDLATEAEVESVHITVPIVPWLVAALETAQFDLHQMIIYELAL
jgi:GNAT superfamily N-acetyltransferase